MERTSSIRRKAMARQHKAEVMIAGEQLRYEQRWRQPDMKIYPFEIQSKLNIRLEA